MSPSLTAILKECFGGSNPSTTSSRSYVNLMSAALLRIGHIEMKIWVGQWLLFQEEGVEDLVCHLVFACFFPLLHSNLVWCHMISHIWGKYRCFNFRKYIVQIHVSTRTSRVACCMKRKRNSCQADTSTHLFFVHLFSHDLSPRRYLLHLGFFKDMEIKFPERKISTRRKESLLRGWFL